MACPAQHMLSASGGIFLRSSKPQATLVRGSLGGNSSSRQFLLASSSSSPSQPAPQEEADCNEEECAPEKEVGSLSAEWLAEERTQVVGTFPPKRKKGWTGLVQKDTAGQTNIYSVEPTVYVAETAISSGAAGTSAEGAENTAAIAGGLVLITVAAASSILIQVSKNQPQLPAADYTGPPLSYYVAKFQPPPPVEAPAPDAPAAPDTAAAPASSPDAEQLSLSS